MAHTKLKTYTVDGVSFEIEVTPGGEFAAIVDGAQMRTNSLKSLEEKIKRHLRTTYSIAVPVTFISDELDLEDKLKIRQATLTGIHAGNQNVIAKDDKTGMTEQLRYFHGHALRRLTGDEIQAIVALNRAALAAMRAVRDFLEEHEIVPRTVVEDAAKAAQAGMVAK